MSLAWTGWVDAPLKLRVGRTGRAMDGRAMLSASAGLARLVLQGIVQHLALADWFDLSHTATLFDRGPSLKSSPHTSLIELPRV